MAVVDCGLETGASCYNQSETFVYGYYHARTDIIPGNSNVASDIGPLLGYIRQPCTGLMYMYDHMIMCSIPEEMFDVADMTTCMKCL